MKNIFILMTNSDLTEGKGPMRITGIFDDVQKAINALHREPTVMGSGPTGRDSNIYEVPVNVSFKNINEFRYFSGYNRKWNESEKQKRYIQYLALKNEFENQ